MPKNIYDYTWITPKLMAYYLSLSYKTVMKFIKNGEIKYYRIGRHYKIKPEDFKEFIEKKAMH